MTVGRPIGAVGLREREGHSMIGGIAQWDYEVWSNTHSTRPGAAGDLLAGQHIVRAFAPTPSNSLPLLEVAATAT